MCGANIYSSIYAFTAFTATTFSLPLLQYDDSGFRCCAAVSSETTHPEARRHVPKALNPQKHRCANLKPCTLIYKYKNLLHIFVCCTHAYHAIQITPVDNTLSTYNLNCRSLSNDTILGSWILAVTGHGLEASVTD